LRARENVEDDWFVRPERAMARFMGIAGLFAAGDDGVAGQTV
jgi:hypothetical protein